MRLLVPLSVLALAAATAAKAQVTQFQLDDLRAQQQAADRRAIDQANQLQALDARMRADQAVAEMTVQRLGARAPELPYVSPVARGVVTTPTYPSMSDSVLAQSNQRVQDAVRNRR